MTITATRPAEAIPPAEATHSLEPAVIYTELLVDMPHPGDGPDVVWRWELAATEPAPVEAVAA